MVGKHFPGGAARIMSHKMKAERRSRGSSRQLRCQPRFGVISNAWVKRVGPEAFLLPESKKIPRRKMNEHKETTVPATGPCRMCTRKHLSSSTIRLVNSYRRSEISLPDLKASVRNFREKAQIIPVIRATRRGNACRFHD